MPHDLFGDVTARPRSARARRSPLVVFSVGVHVVLIAGFVVVSIVTPEALPFPQGDLCMCDFDLVDITLPKVPPEPKRSDVRRSPVDGHGETLRSDVPPTDIPAGIPADRPDVEPGGNRPGSGDTPAPEPPHEPIEGSGLPEVKDPPPPPAPIRLHSGIRAPRRLNEIAPVYPTIAREAHVEGVVILEATIDARGAVQTARVLRSIPLLDEAALTAVRQWQFEPALLNGQPVAVIMTVTVKFTLNR